MNINSDPKVPFTREKITKCFCPQCPVQGDSQCVKDKMEKLPEMMKTTGDKVCQSPGKFLGYTVLLVLQHVMTLTQSKCAYAGGCPIFEEYNLVGGKPMFYYCRDGMAKAT